METCKINLRQIKDKGTNLKFTQFIKDQCEITHVLHFVVDINWYINMGHVIRLCWWISFSSVSSSSDLI